MEQQSSPRVRYNTTKQPQVCVEAWLPLVTALSVSPENPEPEHQLRGIDQGRTPIPSLNCCLPAMGTHIIDTQSAPAFTESFELASKLHWKNKTLTCSKNSSMKRSRSTLTVTSSSSSLSFACNKTERSINKSFLQILQIHFRRLSWVHLPLHLCSLAPVSWDKHQ